MGCNEIVRRGIFSCAGDFCDSCEHAGYCDSYCEHCTVEGGMEEEEETGSSEQSCSKGDSICPSLPSKNDDKYEDDKLNPVTTQSNWCIILTAAICPAPGMTHTKRSNPFLRLREYRKVVRSWSEQSATWRGRGGRGPPKLVFVENSGANLDELRLASKYQTTGYQTDHQTDHHNDHHTYDGIEFVSWHDSGILGNVQLGKGHAEYRSIDHAIENSASIDGCDMVVKVTGRYFIPSLFDELERLGDDIELALQSTENFWSMWDDDGGIIRSEVVGFKKGSAKEIFEGQNEIAGLPMERMIVVNSRKMKNGRIGRFHKMEVEKTRNAEGIWIEFL